jgi:hypothetical protein
MRKVWDLPTEEASKYIDPVWLALMLAKTKKINKGLIPLLLWLAFDK